MATIYDKSGGAFGGIVAVEHKAAGAMVNAVAGKIRVAGVWQVFWQPAAAPAVAMPDVNDYKEASFGTVSAGINLSADGTFSTAGDMGTGPNSGTWRTAGVDGDVEVYATNSGGSGATWNATAWNTWVTLGSFYASLDRTTNGSSSGVINLTFRNKATQAQLDTAVVDVSVYRGTIA